MMCWTKPVVNRFSNTLKINALSFVLFKDELIRFRAQQVKEQGHIPDQVWLRKSLVYKCTFSAKALGRRSETIKFLGRKPSFLFF